MKLKGIFQVSKHLLILLNRKYQGQRCSSLENTVNSHEQIISIFKELEGMGFGLEELKLLWNTINEIAVANNIPLNEAQRKFFKDIEEQYDKKLGFESKVQNLKAEVNMLTQEKK